MPNRKNNDPDRIDRIRTYLKAKSKDGLTDLLLELVQGMDEPTRQRFWEHLAPPGMATADLRYPSADDFLAELEEFYDAVVEGEYYDEEAAAYFGEDYYNDYGDYDEYDLDDHVGLQALQAFLHEANSYFDAGQFAVTAQAYDILLDLVLAETYETLGLPNPLKYLPGDQRQVVSHYFAALQASQPQTEFFTQALRFLAAHENPTDLEHFLHLVGSEDQPLLLAHLEAWADQRAQTTWKTPLRGLAFQLRLLLRFYEQASRIDDMRVQWVRFRRLYPSCYVPLLADRQDAEDWQAVLTYTQEALEVAPPPRPTYYFESLARPDMLSLRGYLARAYSATGEPTRAFKLYRPAFDDAPSFDTYFQTLQLANAVSAEKGQRFTDEVIDLLRQQGERQRYLLCQVYLSEGRFDGAYSLVAGLTRYQGLEESKLVAKAHLLAALGAELDNRMGENLRDLYTNVKEGQKEPVRIPTQLASLFIIVIQVRPIIYPRLPTYFRSPPGRFHSKPGFGVLAQPKV